MKTQKIYKDTPLETALAYKNPSILHKFMEYYDVSYEKAEMLFTETKRYLWLAVYFARQNRKDIYLPPPFNAIDEMWHTFILFTEEYHDYCEEMYGHYVHHVPNTKQQKDQMFADYETDNSAYYEKKHAELKQFYEAVYDVLGEEVLLNWRIALPPQYILADIRRVAA